jgi:hypothetical protein
MPMKIAFMHILSICHINNGDEAASRLWLGMAATTKLNENFG